MQQRNTYLEKYAESAGYQAALQQLGICNGMQKEAALPLLAPIGAALVRFGPMAVRAIRGLLPVAARGVRQLGPRMAGAARGRMADIHGMSRQNFSEGVSKGMKNELKGFGSSMFVPWQKSKGYGSLAGKAVGIGMPLSAALPPGQPQLNSGLPYDYLTRGV